METNTKRTPTPTPGPIGRSGTFLWQMDSPSGAGINLWSGKLDANNGYGPEYALKAATLFEAAPDLLRELQRLLTAYRQAVKLYDPNTDDAYTVDAHNAIAKAIGGQ